MRRVVLVLSLLAACGDPYRVADTIYDPCSGLRIVPWPDTQPDELTSIDDAIAVWTRVIPVRIDVSLEPADAGLEIEFASGDTFYRAIYWDSIGLISISREHLGSADRAIAIAHELGHAFGLPHVPPDERPSVMNVGNLDVAPTAADGLAVGELWPACGTQAQPDP